MLLAVKPVGRMLLAVSCVAQVLLCGHHVLASLDTDSASHAAAVAAAAAAGGYKARLTGRCERITIPLCLDMKYNMTRMPNLVGQSTQAEAAMQVFACFVYRISYTWGDNDVISFLIYASWFSPSCCG